MGQAVELLKYVCGSCGRDWSGLCLRFPNLVLTTCLTSETGVTWCSELRFGQYSCLLLPACSTVPWSHVASRGWVGRWGEEVGLNILYYQVKGKHPKGSKGNKVVVGGQRGLRLGWTWELELLVPLVCAQPFALSTVPALEHTTFNTPVQSSQPAFAHGIYVYRHLCLKWVQAGKGREVCQSWDHLQSSNWKMFEFSDSLEPKSSVVFLQSPTACCFFKFYR